MVKRGSSPVLGLKAILIMDLMLVRERNILRVVSKDDDRTRWTKLVEQYKDIFATDQSSIKDVRVHIHLKPDAKQVFRRARPVPYSLQAKVEKALEKAVLMGNLEPVARSEWASSCVHVMKSNGEVRI